MTLYLRIAALLVLLFPVSALGFNNSEKPRLYIAVTNGEGDYACWLYGRETPLGLWTIGDAGTKEECRQYIEKIWVDKTPLSIKRDCLAPSGVFGPCS